MTARCAFRRLAMVHLPSNFMRKQHIYRSMHCLRCLGESGHIPSFPAYRHRLFSQLSMCNSKAEALRNSVTDSVALQTRKELRNLTPEMRYRFDLIKMEHYSAISQVNNILENPTDEDWLYMLKYCNSLESRIKHLAYLYKKIKMKESKKKTVIPPKTQQDYEEEGPDYGKIMLRVQKTATQMYQMSRLIEALQHGPDVVVDLSFCDTLPLKAMKHIVSQIRLMLGANKTSRQPFHVHLSSVTPGRTETEILQAFPNLDTLPVTVSTEGYLKHYPAEKLVYLSTEATEKLERFNGDDVYIMGGIVHQQAAKFTHAKATQEGIRSAKLPYEEYDDWKRVGKSLSLGQLYTVLLKAAETKSDWNQAFSHVLKPKKKQKN